MRCQRCRNTQACVVVRCSSGLMPPGHRSAQVEAARAKLQARLLRGKTAGGGSSGGGGNVLGTTLSAGSSSSSSSSPLLDGLVSRQPLLLVEDVDALLDELQR